MTQHRAAAGNEAAEEGGCVDHESAAATTEPDLRSWAPGSPEPEGIRSVRTIFTIWVRGADGLWRNPRKGLEQAHPWEYINRMYTVTEFRGFGPEEDEPGPTLSPRRLWRRTVPSPEVLLLLPVDGVDGQVITLRTYLFKLLFTLWQEGSDFDAKRPLGNDDWQYLIYDTMVRAGYVRGYMDEDHHVTSVDVAAADTMIAAAIEALGSPAAPQDRDHAMETVDTAQTSGPR